MTSQKRRRAVWVTCRFSGATTPGVLDQLELFLPPFGEGVSEDSSFVSDFSVVVAVVIMVAVSVYWPNSSLTRAILPHSQQPTLSPGLPSALFFPKNKVEDADDETEAKADPGQYEAVAMVRTCDLRPPACEPSCVNGDSNQNAHPANQHDGSSDVETFAFLQGEQLDNEHDKCDDGEND